MKQVSYCSDCGSAVDAEMGFCPKCDFEGDVGDDGIPPLADLWDLSMEQLGELAEKNSIRGWRRLKQQGLIYQLNQLRLTEAEGHKISALTDEFIYLAQERNVEEAKKKYAEICELSEQVDEQVTLTMDWLLLPEQIAAAVTVEDIPELAYQFDDPEIQQAAQAMVVMISFRQEVEEKLFEFEAVSDIPEYLLNHADPIVNSLVIARRDELKDAAREKAKGKMMARKMKQERKNLIAEIDTTMSLDDFNQKLLKHFDDKISQHAEKRLKELERKSELMQNINSAENAEDILNEALEHEDDEVRKKAKLKRRKLLGEQKDSLLKIIRNSMRLDEIPASAYEYHDSEVVAAAKKRKKYLVRSQKTIESISDIYAEEPLNEMLEHENRLVREAARLRLRLLDEVPAKLRARSKTARMMKMVDDLAVEWAEEAEAAERHQADVMGKAVDVGFKLGDEVDVSYIGQSFTGTVQGFTSDGEFVEILNTETETVWPIPFSCVTPK